MNFKEKLQYSKDLEEEALAVCNDEPIQAPGAVQAYGALLAFDFESKKITYISKNLKDHLAIPDQIEDSSVQECFSEDDYHAISNIASHRSSFAQREYVKTIKGKENLLETSLYRTDNHVVLEFVPREYQTTNINVNIHVKWVLDQLKEATSIDEILEITVQSLHAITQFDRVKAYKFHPDDSGEVVAETNNDVMESYIGLRFPSYDIPPNARDLFLKTPIRHIYNIEKEDISVVKVADELPPLDMTLGVLRGTSTVHLQYLRNMGVVSTMTLPIIVGGKLWGLFAHHHHAEMAITSEMSYSAELIGQIVSMRLEQQIEKQSDEKIKSLQLDGDAFITLNQSKLYLDTFWNNYAFRLNELIKCDGVAYQIEEHVLTYGNCLSESMIQTLGQKLQYEEMGPIYHTEDLSHFNLGDTDDVCGVLALQIHESKPSIFLYFFRTAVNQKVSWAGDPKKDLVVDESGVRLHPRSSFKHFSELNEGKSEIWNSETLILADIALEKFKKVTLNEKLTNERLGIVVQELNHRMRNILGLVRSISRQSVEKGGTIENYVESLEHRILALSKANDLLTRSAHTSVGLKTLLEQIIPPLCANPNNIHLDGADIRLNPEITPTIVLIIHELSTNALKYGALSISQGKLFVSWNFTDEGLDLLWKEKDGPKVKLPSKKGFGTSIIQNAISYEFGGYSSIAYEEDGLEAKVTIPREFIGESKKGEFVLEQIRSANKLDVVKEKINLLVLEDDFINAQDIITTVKNLSVNEVNTFANQRSALSSMAKMDYQMALLDVNLRNETCIEVARECVKKQITFYYMTGYGGSFLADGTFPRAPVLLKPVATEKLKKIVNDHIIKDHFE